MATQELTNLSVKNSPKVGTVMGRNARGGIDRLSNRELRVERPQGSTGVQGTANFRAVPTITAASLSPAAPLNLPQQPQPEDIGDVIGANNTGLATDGSLSLNGNQLTPTLPPTTPQDSLQSLFSQYLGAQEAPGSTADIYAQEAANAGLEEKRKTYNNLSSRLNSITANRDATILKLEGENMDKGVTKGVFAGQAARINREAAIQALPVQAQLAAAQGNLEMAEAHVDKMFQIKSQDALAQYQFKGKMIDAVYEFATDQEKRRLDTLKESEDKKYAEQQDFLKTQRSLLSSALQQGAPSSVVNAINGAATTEDAIRAAGVYNGDLLAREAKRAEIDQSWESLNIRRSELELSRERLAAELSASGNTYGTIDGKPQNATQALVNSYANRLLESETVFDAVADQFADPLAYGKLLPSELQSGQRQQYEQAKRNFVNSVLRRESGAVISPEEFKSAEMQYFPQAGDKPETVLQKEQNRNTVINNFYREANVPRPVFAGDIIESGGKKYQVAEDGVTLIEI